MYMENDMESSGDRSSTKNVPVYLSFATFQAALSTLRTHGLPRKIDRTAWDSRSGADQTQILSAFKFLGLIDDNANTQPALDRLKEASPNSEEEKKILGELLLERYSKVFEHDLRTATPGQLADAIGSYGATGTTKERALRFFIKAARFSGIPMSPRFVKVAASSAASAAPANGASKTPSSVRPRRKKRGNGGTGAEPENPAIPAEHGTAMRTIALPTCGGTLTISGTFNPFALSGAERDLVYQIIDMMAGFEAKAAK
jgi:hypothetical protein